MRCGGTGAIVHAHGRSAIDYLDIKNNIVITLQNIRTLSFENMGGESTGSEVKR